MLVITILLIALIAIFWAYQLLPTCLFLGHERFNLADLSWGGLPQFNRYALPQSDSRM